TTGRVVGERHLQTLRDLGRIAVKSAEEACRVALKTLAANPYDVPFALIYLMDEDGKQARLVCASELEEGDPAASKLIPMNGPVDLLTWPLREVFETSR